ncbi:MAG: lysozyme inhibitor LprI family protein [Actinomycetota bacterium]
MIAPPPAIHEPFTLLPCPAKQISTLDYEGCAEHAIVRTDTQIDTLTRQIFGRIRTKDGRAAFVRSEAAWLVYRKTSCAAAASKYAGGTFAGIVDSQCQADRNRVHVGELRDLLKTLSTP